MSWLQRFAKKQRGSFSDPKTEDQLVDQIRHLLSDNTKASMLFDAIINQRETERQEAHLWPHVREYNRAMSIILGQTCPAPTYFFHSSWSFGTPTGDLHNRLLGQVFVAFEEALLDDLESRRVEGDVVEFGIFQGGMLSKLLAKLEAVESDRRVYGFDSFEGLSKPSTKDDYDSWKEGQYSASYETVSANLRLSERPHLTLVKGWLENSLKSPEATAIKKIAYARIDVDIHDPTRDCLRYLSDRLTNGSIIVFDDWAYTIEKGESKAFIDWVPIVPHLRFEWLGQCSSRFYLRVHHR